jgi:hypothetical protein
MLVGSELDFDGSGACLSQGVVSGACVVEAVFKEGFSFLIKGM